jgi:23S rRNA (pseudouridine1915-N3)-methyltransferase
LKISIVAVGRARQGPERATYEHYIKRIRWPLTLREIPEDRGTTPAGNRRKDALMRAVPDGATVIALDERGDSLTSAQFAQQLQRWRDDGVAELAFLIGGANGLDAKVRKSAQLVLSFGRVTWPHLLMRALLAEQLYRAQQILDGHPYHRA